MRTHSRPGELTTEVLDWGSIKWSVTDALFPGAPLALGEVVVNPSHGHARHVHEDADEVLHVLDGEGVQTVGEEEFAVGAGDTVFIPRGVEHSTLNTGWRQLRFTVIYAPAGAEQALRALPEYEELAPGAAPSWVRSAPVPR